jgi:hypothetical protein
MINGAICLLSAGAGYLPSARAVTLDGPLLFRYVASRPAFTSFDLPAEADLAFWFPVCTLA